MNIKITLNNELINGILWFIDSILFFLSVIIPWIMLLILVGCSALIIMLYIDALRNHQSPDRDFTGYGEWSWRQYKTIELLFWCYVVPFVLTCLFFLLFKIEVSM